MSKLTNMSDEALLKKLSSGSVRAYETLFIRHYPAVRRFLATMLGDGAVAEDLAQDVFIKLWVKRSGLADVRSLKDWLFVVARNAALNVLKSKDFESVTYAESWGGELSGRPSDPDTSSRLAEYNEATRRLQLLIDKLPPVRGEVFRLSRIENLSGAQIAERLGISVRTVEKHIELALRDLRNNFN